MSPVPAGRGGAWSISRCAWITGVVASVLLAAAIIAGGFAVTKLSGARASLLDVTGPQVLQANALSTALLNQETGIRGFQLTRQPQFLDPYRDGVAAQDAAVDEFRRLGALPGTQGGADLATVLQGVDQWRAAIADPVLAGGTVSPAQVLEGKTRFDQLRITLATQQSHLEAERTAARGNLADAAGLLTAMLVTIAVLLCAAIAGVFVVLHRTLIRPIRRLAGEVRDVTLHDITRHVGGTGPREIRDLAGDVESLRARIVDEVTQLDNARQQLANRTEELERSNSDLEQFAYVASHDLQEPLRKVASFCQLLQKRYQDHLDERGNQYIGFAVDGAKRMQVLINDLLAFSRVGRRTGEPTEVDTAALLKAATANLDTAISETGARITHDDLPTVTGEPALLTAVLQNLIGNAVKFRGEDPPEIHVAAERHRGEWRFSVTDNGIGISEEYAERIFVIFQRLHGRAEYSGTGIGLAMCRKIIEHHGGTIWLDTTHHDGSRFCFTLPTNSEQRILAGSVTKEIERS